MDVSLTGSGYLLPMVIISIVIVVVIAVVLFQRVSKKKQYLKGDSGAARHRLDYQPEAKPIPGIQPTVRSTPLARTSDVRKPKDIDLTTTRKDLSESLAALAGKYSLSNFTIATADGLVFASSGGDTTLTDAATYSALFKNDPLTGTPGITLFGLTHKGSELIGIVKEMTPLPNEVVKQIAADTKVILNWWI